MTKKLKFYMNIYSPKAVASLFLVFGFICLVPAVFAAPVTFTTRILNFGKMVTRTLSRVSNFIYDGRKIQTIVERMQAFANNNPYVLIVPSFAKVVNYVLLQGLYLGLPILTSKLPFELVSLQTLMSPQNSKMHSSAVAGIVLFEIFRLISDGYVAKTAYDQIAADSATKNQTFVFSLSMFFSYIGALAMDIFVKYLVGAIIQPSAGFTASSANQANMFCVISYITWSLIQKGIETIVFKYCCFTRLNGNKIENTNFDKLAAAGFTLFAAVSNYLLLADVFKLSKTKEQTMILPVTTEIPSMSRRSYLLLAILP